MSKSAIEWTDEVWNPVTGCTKVSPGCKHCYAERFWHRWSGPTGPYAGRAFADVRCHPERLDQPLRWKTRRRVFVNSMSDLFHESVSDEFLDQVFGVMALASHHSFQVLTKRPDRVLAYLGGPYQHVREGRVGHQAMRIARSRGEDTEAPNWDLWWDWPLHNVWVGVSVEDQATADERIPLLLQTPAAVRWVSAEPLLGPVDLHAIQIPGEREGLRFSALTHQHDDRFGSSDTTLDWVVVGGESGPKARPMHPNWVRSLRDQCQATRVPFFFKQWGEHISASDPRCPVGPPLSAWTWSDGEPFRREHARTGRDAALLRRVGKRYAGRVLDGRTWDQYPEPA